MHVQLVMADDDATPSNPQIAPVQQEELEEAPFDLNVSQRSCEEESPRRMVRTRIDRLVWDRRLSPHPHALAIYLEFIPARGAALESFEECQCEDDDVCLHCRTWIPGDGHYRWLRGPIIPFPLEHRAKYLACTIHRILDFFTTVIYSLSPLFNCNSLEAIQAEMLLLKFDSDSI
jgi:hypothetical protein